MLRHHRVRLRRSRRLPYRIARLLLLALPLALLLIAYVAERWPSKPGTRPITASTDCAPPPL